VVLYRLFEATGSETQQKVTSAHHRYTMVFLQCVTVRHPVAGSVLSAAGADPEVFVRGTSVPTGLGAIAMARGRSAFIQQLGG